MATFGQKIGLLRGLLTGEEARVGPFFAFMEPTRRCNLTCLGCRFHSPQVNKPSRQEQSPHDISPHLAAKYIDDLKAMGTKSLFFVGAGEPFLHPRLFDFVAQAKRAGLTLTVITNGTLLDDSHIKALLDCPPDQLTVSFWASTPSEYERHYPGSDPTNLGRVKEGLRRLARMKADCGQKFPVVALHRVITKHNYHNLGDLVDIARETGANRLSFSPLRTWRGQMSEAALSPEEVGQACRDLRQLHRQRPDLLTRAGLNHVFRRYRLGEAVWENVPCYIGWFYSSLRLDGMIRSCSACDLIMGDLKTDSLAAIWNGPAYRDFRRRTLTRTGLAALGDQCDCGFCCFVADSLAVHRIFRWFAFLRRRGEGPLPPIRRDPLPGTVKSFMKNGIDRMKRKMGQRPYCGGG